MSTKQRNETENTCRQCGEIYTLKELERILGTFSAVLFSGCCSAPCYTQQKLGKNK